MIYGVFLRRPGGSIIPLLIVFFILCVNSCGNNAGFKRSSTGIDFAHGNYDFLFVDVSPAGANRAALSLIDYNEGKAVKAELTGDGVPYIVIDASSLLGKKVALLREMRLTIGVDNPTGEFFAVSGEIRAYSGADRRESSDRWSVYLPAKNPNIARAVLENEGEYFVPNACNFFTLSREVDNALSEAKPPSDLIISEIHFFDANGKELPVNLNAGFAAPEGFGVPDTSNLFALKNEVNISGAGGNSKNWGQAVSFDAVKNGGHLDSAFLKEGAVITVYFASASPPELIFQSWTKGAPESSHWAKIPPQAVNNSGSAAQYFYKDMAGIFGSEDFLTYLDKIYVGDTGNDLTVYAVTIGNAE
jgi:hypothetical protein